MCGAFKQFWPLPLLVSVLLGGCGNTADPNATTQFRPVDEDEQPTPTATKANSGQTSPVERPPVIIPAEKPATQQPDKVKPATSGKTPSERPPAKGAKEKSKDPALAGPTGDKVRLVRTLLRSLGSEPPGKTQQEKLQNLMGQLQQTTETAEEILAVETAPPEARDEALLAKFQVASLLLQFQIDKDAKQYLTQAATELAQASSPQYATLGRVQLFKIHAMEVLQLQPADAKDVLTALQTLLEAGIDAAMFAREVMPLIQQLEQLGYPKDGVAAIQISGDYFAVSKQPSESLMGKTLQIRALVGKLRLGDGDATKLGDEIVATAKSLVDDTQADPSGLEMLHGLAFHQEGAAPELSGKLYDLMEASYAEHKDSHVAEKAKELLASRRQRLELVGKPLAISGALVGGAAFDWKAYEGKVVLLHFWLSTNEPSLGDLSNIDRLNTKFQARGLEVVGVNLDEKVKTVERLFEDQKLPWPTVTGVEVGEQGFKHPTAKACGVIAESLPFNVLIGGDGKIVAAGLQSPLLDEAIVKLLPPAKKPPKEEPGEKPEQSETTPEPVSPQPEEEAK